MAEADKTQRFAIATLLEILGPEQNHLFHDKHTHTSVDIDLFRCPFITAGFHGEGEIGRLPEALNRWLHTAEDRFKTAAGQGKDSVAPNAGLRAASRPIPDTPRPLRS